MSLTDDQVAGELKKMTAFIKQEAQEKAREIHIKADEEFAIEKSKLVRSECASVDAQYERKFKQAGLAQQIARSNVTNKTRLKVLGARQELLDKIFEETRIKLKDVNKDTDNYAKVMEGLILEGTYALMEDSLTVKAKKDDFDLVKKVITSASSAYKETSGRNVKIQLDENDPLPAETTGGVYIVSGNGKIDINNTLEERLQILQEEALPSVRNTLFGPSPNRKFFD